ncbi:glycosyltransferase [Calothrix sp. HK-06]|nr:glycosyltransferase [Calothrix sp. HK-06]
MKKIIRIGLVMQGGLNWMGGTEYIKNIVQALASLPSEVKNSFEICLICNKSFDTSLYDSILPYLKNIYYKEKELQILNLANSNNWHLFKSSFYLKNKIDFVYPDINYLPVKNLYYSASWIPDFQYKHLPHLFSQQAINKMEKSFARAAKHSSKVILSSKTAESDFHKYFPKYADKSNVLNFRTFPISVWYNGEPQTIQKEYHLPEKFFIVSNQFWQHKNHLILFKALKLLQEKSIYPVIVCTGSINDPLQPNYSNIILTSINELNLKEQIYLLGLIPRQKQIQLMRRSIAVIQPSLFEGWSTIVEDSRCLGKPMIISDIPVHQEQNPPKSIFFEPNSPENLAAALEQYWENLTIGPDLNQEAIARNNNLADIQTFGYRFLEIVHNTMSSR